ncbi:MAG: hypothetical protein JSW27_19645 [Phycisphaerales bacterium]|nr:MAG: hypothetical protein JSW27_19645 [Phycisphaerales bacterium]
MFEAYRETHDLLTDYAEALREGNLPTFLKSLSRFEARHVLPLANFWRAAEMARMLNSVGFSDGVTIPSMDLFIARVNTRIAARRKKAKSVKRANGKRRSARRNLRQ